jgi:hypothetical protein
VTLQMTATIKNADDSADEQLVCEVVEFLVAN